MRAKALINFTIGHIDARSGDVIEFADNANEQKQMLLNLGWIEPIKESKTASKKNSPRV